MTRSNMLEMIALRALHGPNIWSKRPVMEICADVSNIDIIDWAAADELLRSQGIPGTQAARDEQSCAAGKIAAWLGDAVVKLQTAGQTATDFHTWQPASTPSVIRLAIEFREEAIGKAAVGFALRWLNHLLRRETLDLAAEWESFIDFAYDARLGNSTGPTVAAALARGIPFQRLDSESLVQLGHGCRQRRIRRAATDRTGFIANDISTDKELAKSLLDGIGIPVPRGRTVSDPDDACQVAQMVGFPVVVKPQDADYGNGVTMRVKSLEDVRLAYASAKEWSDGVIVEHHVPGHLFRLLVVAGKLVAAVRREPWFVVGDGRHTLLELIEIANHDPRRGPDYLSPILAKRLETGEMPLLTDDRRPHDCIPADDETVLLRHDVYLKCGGTHIDQADILHPEIVSMAVDATHVIGLDVAGLDVIASDLTKSPHEQEWVVLEVNSEPSIALHMEPLCAPSQPIGEAIIDSLFPSPEMSRIPVIAVLGQAGDLSLARKIVAGRQAVHQYVGLASRDGAWLNDRQLGDSCDSLAIHARRIWRHPRTEAAVVHLTLLDVLRDGLPFAQCDELIECPHDSLSPCGQSDASPDDLLRAMECVRASVVPC